MNHIKEDMFNVIRKLGIRCPKTYDQIIKDMMKQLEKSMYVTDGEGSALTGLLDSIKAAEKK